MDDSTGGSQIELERPEHAAAAGPIAQRERLAALDFLRGVAIFGILMVNMAFFALPFMAAAYPTDKTDWPPGEWAAYLFVKILFEFKFISTFSLLFGAGLIMQMIRAQAAGAGFRGRYFRRIALLAGFGLVHGFLLWYGDILLIYAVIGSALYLFRNLKPRTLLTIAAAMVLFAAVMSAGFMGLEMAIVAAESSETGVEAPADPVALEGQLRGFEAMAASNWDPGHESWQEGEMLAYREGPFADAFAFRSVTFMMALIFTVVGFGWHIFAMFLVGAAMMKVGFFARERREWQGRLAAIALPLGLGIESASALIFARGPAAIGVDDMVAGFLHEFGAATLCLGYVGLGAWLVNSPGATGWSALFRAVGRMALTTYLLSTIVTTCLMYHWGLGWFGQVSRVEMVLLTAAIYLGLVVFSVTWLRLFRFGPFEWVWRSVTYGRLQPLRHHSA